MNSSDAFDHLTDVFQNNRESNDQERLADFPEIVPILPLRGVVVYPQTAVPLTIGQPRSIRLVDDVAAGEKYIGLLTSKELEIENPSPEHLYSIGTLGIIHRLFRAPDGTIRLLVQGIARFRTREFVSDEPYLTAQIEMLPDQEETGLEIEALARNARDQFVHIAELIPSIPREIATSVGAIEDPLQTVYTISNFQRMDLDDAQQILQLDPPSNKLHRLVSILAHEIELLELGQKIQNQARSEIDKVQKEYFLREQLKALQRELGENDDQTVEVEEFRKKIGISKMSPEAEKLAQRELDRLSRMSSSSAEYGVIRNYLDWLTSL
ncbi:endopeptidase La, partial [bacterium]|nr:endopeptidase La [bacterium]